MKTLNPKLTTSFEKTCFFAFDEKLKMFLQTLHVCVSRFNITQTNGYEWSLLKPAKIVKNLQFKLFIKTVL